MLCKVDITESLYRVIIFFILWQITCHLNDDFFVFLCRQFVRQCVIGQWKKNLYNIHWLPTTERCDLCNGHYDYIGKKDQESSTQNLCYSNFELRLSSH